MKQQLAAILHADVAGYSRLVGLDEVGTYQKLEAGISTFSDLIAAHGGRKVNEAGDAILAEFQSATAAFNAAVEFQRQMFKHNVNLTGDDRLEFRIGINLGEVIHDRNDIYGDGVNLAARIQGLADPGGVCISSTVYEQVNGRVDESFDDLGYRKVKNIARSVHVYRVRLLDIPANLKYQETQGELNPFLSGAEVTDKGQLITGGCMCGDVRFDISQPAIATGLCHCRMCQRSSSAAFASWTAFRPEAVRYPKSEPTYYKSSLIAERGFCANCGTRLTMRYYPVQPEDILAILTSSLDHPDDFAPTYHLGIESQQRWLQLNDDLPRSRSEDSPGLRKRWEAVGKPNPADWS